LLIAYYIIKNMPETELNQRQDIEVSGPVAEASEVRDGTEQASDKPRGMRAAIKRHPVRTSILGTAIGIAAGLFAGQDSPSAEKQAPSSPASAPVSPDAQQGTLSTLSPAEMSDFVRNDTKFANGKDATAASGNIPSATPATPSEARELKFCGCGLPAGHGGDHANSVDR
jgi:hypothetical protein